MELIKRKSSEINLSMAVASYVAGVSVSKQNEVNSEVGLISPALSTMRTTNIELKDVIFDLSLNIALHVSCLFLSHIHLDVSQVRWNMIDKKFSHYSWSSLVAFQQGKNF